MNEKKQKILITAMKLFSKSSFHQTSMQQIADVCGVSKGSLYTHFKSKDELLSEIFTYYYHLLNHLIAASETIQIQNLHKKLLSVALLSAYVITVNFKNSFKCK